MLAPIAIVSYLAPVWSDVDSVGARDSAFVVLPVCVLIAEVILEEWPVPLPGEDGYMGAISVLWTRPRARLDSFARQAIELLSLEAGPVLERLIATRRLEQQAERDH